MAEHFAKLPKSVILRFFELSKREIAVLSYLYLYNFEETGQCNQSRSQIAKALQIDRSPVSKAIKSLAEKGFIYWDGKNYVLNENPSASRDDLSQGRDELSHVTKRPQNRDDLSSKGVTICPPPIYKEKQTIQKNRHAEVSAVFSYWQSVFGHTKAKLTPERKRLISARLKDGYTVADLKAAIDGCKASPFHQGENPHSKVYDQISLIFRNGEKIEDFMRTAKVTNQTQSEPDYLMAIKTCRLCDDNGRVTNAVGRLVTCQHAKAGGGNA